MTTDAGQGQTPPRSSRASLLASFGYALGGITGAAAQRNFRIQLGAAVAVLVLSFVLRCTPWRRPA